MEIRRHAVVGSRHSSVLSNSELYTMSLSIWFTTFLQGGQILRGTA